MKILYISYDGLTDFIGQSQVLPYLLGCARAGHRISVISFEKTERRSLIGADVETICRDAGIEWLPQTFRSSPPYLAKAIDQMVMRRAAFRASRAQPFDLIHCRSYPAAVAGLAVKRRFGTPLLFDMRGFWPDQRREGGRWRASSPIGWWLHARWKKHEAELVAAADHIVVLTAAARNEVSRWSTYRGVPISVIPCCAEFNHFTVAEEPARTQARQRLGIDRDSPVLAYLGSLGTVYMIADHLRLFAAIKGRDARAKALFIGRTKKPEILAISTRYGIDLAPTDIVTIETERDAVPYWLGAADAGSCFILPSYSSMGVSPTKLAEYLACGIPVIANHSVGDVESIVGGLSAGYVMQDFGADSIEAAADAFFALKAVDRHALRARARPSLDLQNAVSAYLDIYADPGSAAGFACQ